MVSPCGIPFPWWLMMLRICMSSSAEHLFKSFCCFFCLFFWNWTVFAVSIIISRSQRKKVARYSDKKIKRMKEREVKAAGNTCLWRRVLGSLGYTLLCPPDAAPRWALGGHFLVALRQAKPKTQSPELRVFTCRSPKHNGRYLSCGLSPKQTERSLRCRELIWERISGSGMRD